MSFSCTLQTVPSTLIHTIYVQILPIPCRNCFFKNQEFHNLSKLKQKFYNNINIYLPKLGCYVVVVVILNVYKTWNLLLNCLLTHSTVHSPSWAANWFAASQEIPSISRNLKVHYRTHKCPPLVSILGQLNPVHKPTSHLLEIHPSIIHPSTRRSPEWSLSFRFPYQKSCKHLLLTHTRHMPSPSHSPPFYHPSNNQQKMQTVYWQVFPHTNRLLTGLSTHKKERSAVSKEGKVKVTVKLNPITGHECREVE